MTEVLSVSTALPAHRLRAGQTERYLCDALPAQTASLLAQLAAEATAQNETRYSALPLAELRQLGALDARNRAYKRYAVELGMAAARRALAAAGLEPEAVAAIIGISSTGYLMPTLETHLLDGLRLSTDCRRVPLTQLGCAGGVAGLSLAAELAGTGPVLVVTVELPSLSFPSLEPSPIDVLAAMQFGDGAAAAVVSGIESNRGPIVVGAGRALFPGTIERDRVELTSAGFRLRPPRALASILRRELGREIDRFLARHALGRGEIAFWVVHPRSPELLDAAAASLGLADSALDASRAVWRRNGNMISAAVFHVLDELRASAPPAEGALGMVIAFGAGFACEMVLLRAAGWLSH